MTPAVGLEPGPLDQESVARTVKVAMKAAAES